MTRSSAAELVADDETLAAALRRLVDLTDNRGHQFRPLSLEDVALIKRANAEDPHYARSERCWDCNADGDKPTNPYHDPDGETWGDRHHQRWEAWLYARSLLALLPEHIDGREVPADGGDR